MTTSYPVVSADDSPPLAEAAASSRPLAGARKLAGWIGSGRTVTGSGQLRPGDATQACRDLGIVLSVPRLRSAKDVPELQKYWRTALASGLVSVDGRRAARAERDILDSWFSALTTFLELDDEEDPCPTCLITLHVLYGAGEPLDLEEFAAQVEAEIELPEPDEDGGPSGPASLGPSGPAYALGLDDHRGDYFDEDSGYYDDDEDTGEHLVATLSAMLDFGAVKMTVQTVELTPLGRFLAESVFRQYAPPPDADAATVTSAIDVVPPALFLTVAEPWLSGRSASEAVEELLAFAESAAGQARVSAIALAMELGEDAADVWREWAKRPGFGAYARQWLTAQGEADAEEPGDVAWLVVDAVCAMADGLSDELPDPVVRELVAEQFGEDLAGAADFMRASGHERAEEITDWITAPDE